MDHRKTEREGCAADDEAEAWDAAVPRSGGQPFFYSTPLPEDDRLTAELVEAGRGDPSTRMAPLFMVDRRILVELEAIHSRLLASHRIVPSPAPGAGPQRTAATPQAVPSAIGTAESRSGPDATALVRSAAMDRGIAVLALVLGAAAVLCGVLQIIGGLLGSTPLLSRLLGLDLPVNEVVLGVPLVGIGAVSLWASRPIPTIRDVLAAIR